MVKRIIAAFLLLVMAVGGAGCMTLQKNNFQDQAISYMEEKYGEKFTFVSSWGSSYANIDCKSILVQCDSVSGEILVERFNDVFSDNYLALKYADQVTATVDNLSKSVFSSSWVNYEVLRQTLSENLPANASFSEYCADPRAAIIVSVAVPSSTFDTVKVEDFANDMAENGLHGSIHFAVMDDAHFTDMNADSFRVLTGNNIYQYFAIITINDGGVTIAPREAGH